MVTVNCINFWDMMRCGLVDFNRHFGGRSESNGTVFFCHSQFVLLILQICQIAT
jgi:hypothetical protein